jgi:hypothetical protein
MKDAALDEVILATVGPHWTKVAMVIARASEAQSSMVPGDDDDLKAFGQRIEALVASGALEARGDVTNWRHSEVRKP